MMTKKDFLYGRTFKYVGHFQRLSIAPISYNAQLNQVAHEKPEYVFDLYSLADNGFIVFNKHFGRITIYFKECITQYLCTMCNLRETDNIYQGHYTCLQCADKLKKN